MKSREVSITYDDDALRKVYDKRIRTKLDAIIHQLEANPDANMGMHIETWHPDLSVRASYNVQPGITNEIVRVRVERTEETEKEPPERERKKTMVYVPYLWIGAATYGHSSQEDYTEFPPFPYIFGFEPEPEEGYTFWNSLEPKEGDLPGWCGPGYCFSPGDCSPWPECFTQAAPECPGTQRYPLMHKRHYGAAAEGTGVLHDLGGPCNTEQGDRFPFVGWCRNVSYDERMGVDIFTHQVDALTFMWDEPVEGGNATSNEHIYVKTSRSGAALMGQFATRLYAPRKAYKDVPEHYWQMSVVVDNGNIIPRTRSAKAYARYLDDEPSAVGDAEWDETELPCTILGGEYRFDIAAIGFECSPDLCEGVHVRMILGKSLRDEEEPENADLVAEYVDDLIVGAVTVVDFYIEEIGSNPDQTVVNAWNPRDYSLGGYDPDMGFDDFCCGPNSATTGYWSKSLYVNIKNGSYSTKDFEHIYPFYKKGGPVNFYSCECAIDEGDGGFTDAPNFAPCTIFREIYVGQNIYGQNVYTNIDVLLFGRRMVVTRVCDDLVIGQVLSDCAGDFARGAVYYAVPMVKTGNEQYTVGNYQFRVGDVGMIVTRSTGSKLGLARWDQVWPVHKDPEWRTQVTCPSSMSMQARIRDLIEQAALQGDRLAYSQACHGFILLSTSSG